MNPRLSRVLQSRHDAATRASAAQASRPDHGPSTPALSMRPQRTIETIVAGVTQRVYDDVLLCDRMHRVAQLSDRQHAAALRVVELHADAGFEPKQAGSYAPRGWNGGHDDEAPEARAVTEFRRLLGGCSEAAAWILHGLCLDQHPGVRHLGSLHGALNDLAHRWGME